MLDKIKSENKCIAFLVDYDISLLNSKCHWSIQGFTDLINSRFVFPSLTPSQCTLAGHAYTGMPLVDQVCTGIPLDDPVITCRVHWNTTGKTMFKQPHTGMPLGKLSWNRPTLECHWRNCNFCSLHWNTTGGIVTAHTRPAHIAKQSSIHASLKWQDGGTPISKWTGLCKFSLYFKFIALQWVPVVLLTREYFNITLCMPLICASL